MLRAPWILALVCLSLCLSVATSAAALEPESADKSALVLPEGELSSSAQDQHHSQLQASLRELERQRGKTPRLWPVLTFSTGMAVGLGAGIYGIAAAESCQDVCPSSAAIGLTLAAGVLLGTAGLIWWLKVEERLDRIDKRRAVLKRELQYIEWNKRADLSAPTPLSASLSLSF